MRPTMTTWLVLFLSLTACGDKDDSADPTLYEGDDPGECSDDADNDRDGLVDCDDEGCAGTSACSEGDTDTDADSDTDTDSDSDTDTDSGDVDLHADGSYCEGETLVLPNGTEIDCEELYGYCGETQSGEGACMWEEGGGSSDSGTPSFLTLPLDYDARVVNGWQYNYAANGAGLNHYSIDYEASVGTELYAACDGVAMKSSQYAGGYGYGNFIQIRCDETDGAGHHYHLIYGHIQSAVSSIQVYAEGDRWNGDYGSWSPVSRGDLVGYSGSEDTSWAHLHFQVKLGSYSGTSIDPYDIYASTTSSSHSAEQEYPPDGTRYAGCGDGYLWTICPPVPAGGTCDVSGAIHSHAADLGTLSVTGEGFAAEGLDKWSLVIGSDIVAYQEYSSGQTADSIDIEVDVSAYELANGSHTMGLWVRDVDGCTGDAAVDSVSLSCSADDSYQCYDGDVYYYNSCGTRGSRKDACSSSAETCVDLTTTTAECQSTGPEHDHYQCHGGDVYWYDSAGNMEGIKESCASCESCEDDSSTTASCQAGSHDSYACSGTDIYWYDSCGAREGLKESCPEGCSGSACLDYAADTTSFPLSCLTGGSTSQDILTATNVEMLDPTGDPQVEVRWEKCDGSAFSTSKTCHVHVGTYMPYGVDRHIYETGSDSFTWNSGRSYFVTTFDAWPGSSPFSAASCGAIKEFFVVCDDSSAHPDHWYSSDPITIEKICP